MDIKKLKESKHLTAIKADVLHCDAIRKKGTDIAFPEYVKDKYGSTMESYLDDLGINPSTDTIENLFTTPDADVRWLVPEIFREAISLGLRKGPIWPDLIALEQEVTQLQLTVPHWEMSDATPEYVGEAETIPVGDLGFGQKTVKVRKIGKGIKIPYEVRQYVSINIVSVFLRDMGFKMGYATDAMMIDVLINGEQLNGSESAPVVGVEVPANGTTYRDFLKVWVRMSRLGRTPFGSIAGETMAIDTLDLPEFKDRAVGTPQARINLKTPIPQSTNYYIHGRVPADQTIVVDKNGAIIKLNAQPLLVESEKIVSNQTEATYATATFGFFVLYRDGRCIIDQTLDFATNGFPAWMDVDAAENVEFKD